MGGYSNHLLSKFLPLPQDMKEGRAPAPHSGSECVLKPPLESCWGKGGRSRPSLLVPLGSDLADGVKASCTHPSGNPAEGSEPTVCPSGFSRSRWKVWRLPRLRGREKCHL